MEQQLWDAARQLWTFVAVALVVYQGGVVSKAVAGRLGWRSEPGKLPTAYDLTLRLHPLLAGALFGLVPLPTLDAIDELEPGTRVLARVAWFLLAGALCGQVYELSRFGIDWFKAWAGGKKAPALAPEAAVEDGDPSAGERGNAP